MTHSNVDSDLRGLIEDVVRRQLGSEHVVDVVVVRDEFENDSVLMVNVIVDDTNADFDDGRVLGLARHIRPRLTAAGETAFPVISFSTAREQEHAA